LEDCDLKKYEVAQRNGSICVSFLLQQFFYIFTKISSLIYDLLKLFLVSKADLMYMFLASKLSYDFDIFVFFVWYIFGYLKKLTSLPIFWL